MIPIAWQHTPSEYVLPNYRLASTQPLREWHNICVHSRTDNLFLRGDFRGWSIPIQIVSLLLGMGTAIPVRHLRVDVTLHQRFTYTALSHLGDQRRIELKKSISCALR